MKAKIACLILLSVFIAVGGCSGSGSSSSSGAASGASLDSKALLNMAPYIPPQCYTKTVADDTAVHNTCYACHTTGLRPDFVNDYELQLEYSLPQYTKDNHWLNMFKDRTAQMAAISDEQILEYIRSSNYFDASGNITLASALGAVPEEWDYDRDGVWSGFVPDCYYNFDQEGFDKTPSGGYTGWRAFAYYPFPTTHWPANGSMSDVLIRLPEVFRTRNGVQDLSVYKLNLSILEALIKRRDVGIAPTDEKTYEVDLDKDGVLGTATRIAYDWAPNEGRFMYYVGDARAAQQNNTTHLAAGLFPEGTEFLNTLRYIDIDGAADVKMAARIKEIRYARKALWRTYAELETLALNEVKERDDFPDRLKNIVGDIEDGVSNGKGWVLQGFIESENGQLRPQTFEENSSCIGCHGGIGATTDDMFAFARKLNSDSFQEGWYHWSRKDMKGLNEPKVEFKSAGVQYEYCFYLMYVGAGDEFRSNTEISGRFFDANGFLKTDMAEELHDDVSLLLYPSQGRALALDKAYKVIVDEQSFHLGKEPVFSKALNVYDQIAPADEITKVKQAVILTERARDFSAPTAVEPTGAPAPEALQAAIDGAGMVGPDGARYEISWQGVIYESSYAMDIKGFYFPFPRRQTLPTRIIVPLGAIPSCYQCHRLSGPVPPQNPQVTEPVDLPAASMTESGRTLIQLTNDAGSDIGGEWSPDGQRIAWVSNRTGSFQIWVMDSNGANQRQITQEPATRGWPKWSPDGTRLAYWEYDAGNGEFSILVDSLNGEPPTVIASGAEPLDRPAWRPDSRYIAYARQADSNWDVWVASADGSERFRLTRQTAMETNPLWSPDGSTIAYKVAPDNAYNLTVENLMTFENGFASPTVHQWTGVRSVQMNDWSPQGDKIAYTAEIVTNASGEDRVSYLAVSQEVATANGTVDTGAPIILSNGGALGDRGPVFSPGGDKVAFWSWDKSYRATLWLANTDGSDLTQLTQEGYDMYPKWSPDGTRLLFESQRSGNTDIWTIAIP